ncbi:MAG: DUF1295 domain-containing protein [Actinobacteria bacterium]|nr:DUF1295 domain-containing protein [Actinomycetota bacterium]MBL7060351.1 DUF1295 domain-containing protein [Actinomycetota bacterium]
MDELLVYNILLIIVFVSAIIIFISLFFISAPYGRFIRGGWGLTINARTAWIIMELPAVIVFFILFLPGSQKTNIVAIIFLILWMIHYTNRTFIYPIIMRGGSRRFPILIVLFSILFNSINGYLNGRYLFYFSPGYTSDWIKDPRFIIGLALFLVGFIINIHSDSVLRKLRKPGDSGYRIPYGGFFRYISSANYFGEIIEWIGWAVMTWSLPGLAFALFTIANLAPRALSNHKWYMNKFPEYPKNRKAIIPFVY